MDRIDLVEQALRHPPDASGCSIPVFVLEPDATRARAATASGTLPDSPRVHLFTGPACVGDLADHFRTRLDCRLPTHVMASGRHTEALAREVAAALGAIVEMQSRAVQTCRARLEARWNQRTMAWWSERYAAINGGAPARVLVVTSRFSTFVQHAAADLVDAFAHLGHEARSLMEPDDFTSITPHLCLRTIDAFDPDLIVVINYPRAMHRELFPEGWPHVCWVQDAMPHQFAELPPPGPLDFIAGHLYDTPDAADALPAGARLPFPVPVSERKFHPTPVAPDVAGRFACDIAYVSHTSQTPDAFHREFAAHFDAARRPAFDICRARVEEAMSAWHLAVQHDALVEARTGLAAALNCAHDPRTCDLLWHQYIHPLSERLLRHQTLEWAAAIAGAHALDFRIYGNGWHQHPTLHPYAAGPLAHGDDLR
ncbi:MAG: hypothetical protein KDA21_15340, partial [Phycisphaerales bacterium]|nr:hypothetical protein [Phycisphaerales bacterium]